MMRCNHVLVCSLIVFVVACSGGDSSSAADAGTSDLVADGGGEGCDAIDCGPGSVCDDSLGVAYCSCSEGSCNGGSQCVEEIGVSMCACSDGSLYQGGACPQAGTCPTGMSWIHPPTCIDDLEFSINAFLIFLNGLGSACDDPGPTCTACGGQRCFPSEAVNPWHYDNSDSSWWVEGQTALSLSHPARYITFDAARTACLSVGKRLCGADEWETSCGGLSGRDYPYGNEYEPDRCNQGGHFGGRPWERGESAECANLEHPALRDQSGNVWEWTDSCNGSTCYVRGGSYAVNGSFFPDALGCYFKQGHERGSAEFDIGFRCCANPL
jgi:hypothetical protein